MTNKEKLKDKILRNQEMLEGMKKKRENLDKAISDLERRIINQKAGYDTMKEVDLETKTE